MARIKSQTTIFIILAVFIVGAISTMLIFRNNDSPKDNTLSTNDIYSFTQSCIKQTAEDSIYYIGSTGGYFNSPNLSTPGNTAYYLYNKKNYMPSKERVEQELANYMNEMLFFCTKGFVDYPEYTVSQEKIITTVKIEEGKVVFNVKYPLSITKENKTYFVSRFDNNEIPVRLDVVYDSAKEIIEEQMKHPEDICVNCLGKISEEEDIYIDMYDYNQTTIIFEIADPNSNINGGELRFTFANKY